MKRKSFLLTALLLSCLQICAQLPLVGTWELISMKGTSYDGKPFSVDASMQKVIKIITPTHYMLIAHALKGDSLIFSRSHAGNVLMDDKQYSEVIKLASWENLVPYASCSFKWEVKGDRLTKTGSITLQDGKTMTQEEMVFKRVKSATSYPNNPSNGTWDQLSSSFIQPDGKKGSHTRETATRFEIITPTHWCRLSHRNGKFENAMVGTYAIKGNKVYQVIEAASFPVDGNNTSESIHRIEGGKRYVSGKFVNRNGKTLTWDDIFQRVDADVLK